MKLVAWEERHPKKVLLALSVSERGVMLKSLCCGARLTDDWRDHRRVWRLKLCLECKLQAYSIPLRDLCRWERLEAVVPGWLELTDPLTAVLYEEEFLETLIAARDGAPAWWGSNRKPSHALVKS